MVIQLECQDFDETLVELMQTMALEQLSSFWHFRLRFLLPFAWHVRLRSHLLQAWYEHWIEAKYVHLAVHQYRYPD